MDTDTQTAIGTVICVVIIIALGKWQEYQHKRRQNKWRHW